jgi:hypothetical protein
MYILRSASSFSELVLRSWMEEKSIFARKGSCGRALCLGAGAVAPEPAQTTGASLSEAALLGGKSESTDELGEEGMESVGEDGRRRSDEMAGATPSKGVDSALGRGLFAGCGASEKEAPVESVRRASSLGGSVARKSEVASSSAGKDSELAEKEKIGFSSRPMSVGILGGGVEAVEGGGVGGSDASGLLVCLPKSQIRHLQEFFFPLLPFLQHSHDPKAR